jgi:uncharacterized small protein (DUF1192 family)
MSSGWLQGLMSSDKRGKTDRRELLDMATKPSANHRDLEPVEPHSFRYKLAQAARIGEDTGQRVGSMAQDMERSPAGEEVVLDTPNGKALDIHRALGFSLAGVAGLGKRVARADGRIARLEAELVVTTAA